MADQSVLTSTRLRIQDTPEALYAYLEEHGYGDGLPVVPPTADRVAAYVDYLGRPPSEVVAVLPPAMGVATVEKIAVNAVLAGCRPDHLPVLVAAVAAGAEPPLNLRTLQVSSNPVGILVIVNGPVRTAVSVHSGGNCLGPGYRANLTIGRALQLILRHIGGATPGTVDLACQGYPGKTTFCFGENEEQSPWPPLPAGRGFGPGQSTVTVVGAQGTSNIAVHGGGGAGDVLRALAHGMINPGANNYCTGGGEPLLVLNPGHARRLAAGGLSKQQVQEYLYTHARVPLDWYSESAVQVRRLADRAINGAVPVADAPEHILVVVAGAPGTHSTFVPTFGDTWSVTKPVSRSGREGS